MNTSTCIGCSATDDHPKHQIVVDAEHTSVFWHMDCHRIATSCEVCTAQTAGAPAGAIGDALREHLLATPSAVSMTAATETGV
jgi:hypothetical protein